MLVLAGSAQRLADPVSRDGGRFDVGHPVISTKHGPPDGLPANCRRLRDGRQASVVLDDATPIRSPVGSPSRALPGHGWLWTVSLQSPHQSALDLTEDERVSRTVEAHIGPAIDRPQLPRP